MLSQLFLTLALTRPKSVLYGTLSICLLVIGLVAAPFVAPTLPLTPLTVDTDPENMLPADHPARLLHAERSRLFGIDDTIVIAVENDRRVDGVFTQHALAEITDLTEFAASVDGVIADDIISPSTVEGVEITPDGTVRVAPLIDMTPPTDAGAVDLRARIARMPIYGDTLLSLDGRSILMLIPIENRQDAHRIATALRERITEMNGDNTYSITGLPVAQAQFGIEMFIQMAIVAPAAMALIFLLLTWMFGSWRIALAPMAVAMVSTIGAMGALIISGNTIHIMSSMIAIFVMPIAVMDAIHILSDFADRQRGGQGRADALRGTIIELWRPMLFTTVTTCAGFASLALAPIPPVQVFGLFVALGVLIAWAATLLIVPAILTLLPETTLQGVQSQSRGASGVSLFARLAQRAPRLVIASIVAIFAVSAIGLSYIQINDSPINWFAESHEIRRAEALVSDNFDGAFFAYLTLSSEPGAFGDPDQIAYLSALSTHLETTGLAANATGLPDLLASAIAGVPGLDLPETSGGIEDLLEMLRDNGMEAPLERFVTSDLSQALLAVQMLSGENLDMRALEAEVTAFLAHTPAPATLSADWFGVTQLNAVWQDAMVEGMMMALAGGFATVFVLMLVLMRSLVWSIVAMLPLTFSIAGIYGIIGWIGRDLDMPIAVLSALSLGLAVDFAIHFVARLRQAAAQGDPDPIGSTFGEPARAIWRNVLVLGVGFMPLLTSPLVPYRVVGVLIPVILAVAAFVTLLFIGGFAAAIRSRTPTNASIAKPATIGS